MAHKFRFSLLLNLLPAHRGVWSAERDEGCREGRRLPSLGRPRPSGEGAALQPGRGQGRNDDVTRASESRQTRKEVPFPDSGQCRREL